MLLLCCVDCPEHSPNTIQARRTASVNHLLSSLLLLLSCAARVMGSTVIALSTNSDACNILGGCWIKNVLHFRHHNDQVTTKRH